VFARTSSKSAVILKLQRIQNGVLRAINNFGWHIEVREMHMALKITYITKLCRKHAEVIQNHSNPNVRATEKGEAMHRKCKSLIIGGGQAYDYSSETGKII
jgi:hypothetical protein